MVVWLRHNAGIPIKKQSDAVACRLYPIPRGGPEPLWRLASGASDGWHRRKIDPVDSAISWMGARMVGWFYSSCEGFHFVGSIRIAGLLLLVSSRSPALRLRAFTASSFPFRDFLGVIPIFSASGNLYQ